MFGVTFSQRRNDVLFTADYLKRIVTNAQGLSEAATRDLIIASISIKYTQVCYCVVLRNSLLTTDRVTPSDMHSMDK